MLDITSVLQKNYINLYSYQQCRRIPVAPPLSNTRYCQTFKMFANQMDVKYYCNLHFLVASEVDYLFISLLALQVSFSVNCLFVYFIHFLVELLAFYQLIFKNILEVLTVLLVRCVDTSPRM